MVTINSNSEKNLLVLGRTKDPPDCQVQDNPDTSVGTRHQVRHQISSAHLLNHNSLTHIVHSPINFPKLKEFIANYDNYHDAHILVNGFRSCFKIEFTGPRLHVSLKI